MISLFIVMAIKFKFCFILKNFVLLCRAAHLIMLLETKISAKCTYEVTKAKKIDIIDDDVKI